ncbi:MAG: carboxylate--amine ligase [Micrococcales bacterium 70-64]|nr:PAC2 family protein [Leifsonia sp.]ODU65242.1 MAG: carboxylate--amine ligase [Leifsonia sp. SCN 70-46]OJX86934.1 MAG: carboxylate--amine ligase [Micrococcales bacterium 70-64]
MAGRFASGRLLVVAFEGWNDAGEAASGAVRTLKDVLDLYPIAEVDPEDYFDYQFNRPSVAADENGDRHIVWPGVTAYGPTRPHTPQSGEVGANAANIYLLLGTEPSRGWKTFTREILEVIESNEITSIVFLGAMLADVPHSRPISVFTSSENAEVRAQLDIERSGYEGPVGILSVLADAAEKAGITTMSIWASVPHYVHNAPSPKATLAILDKLEEIVDVVIPRGDLVSEAQAWENGIDALAGDDDDMASYIEQLEQARDTVDSPEASGEAIAEEFERYLRRGGDGKPGDGTAGDEPWRPKPE